MVNSFFLCEIEQNNTSFKVTAIIDSVEITLLIQYMDLLYKLTHYIIVKIIIKSFIA